MTDTTERPLCRSTTKTGAPCQRRARPGHPTCGIHADGAKIGRPTKLTPDKIATIVEAVTAGAFRDQAAAVIGIGRTTLYDYLARGQTDLDNGVTSIYAELQDALTRAEAQAELTAIQIIRQHAPMDWRAAAWYLERKYPAKWGRSVVTHEGNLTLGKPVVHAPDSDEERLAIAQILAQAGALTNEEDTTA